MKRVRARTVVILAVGALALAAAGVALASVTVTLTAAGPQPETVTVPWGETVVFGNQAGEPQVIEIPRETYTSETIPSGGTLEHVFEGGAGAYIVRQVGAQVHQGRVVVEVAGAVTLTADETVALASDSRFGAVHRSRLATDSIVRAVESDPGTWQEVATAEVAEDERFSRGSSSGGRAVPGGGCRGAGSLGSYPGRRPAEGHDQIADASVPVGGLLRVNGKVTPADSASAPVGGIRP